LLDPKITEREREHYSIVDWIESLIHYYDATVVWIDGCPITVTNSPHSWGSARRFHFWFSPTAPTADWLFPDLGRFPTALLWQMVFVQKINLEKKKKKSTSWDCKFAPVYLAYNYRTLKTGFLQRLASDTASLHCVGDELYSQGGYIWKRDERSFYSTQIDRKYFITGTRSFMGMRFFYPVQCSACFSLGFGVFNEETGTLVSFVYLLELYTTRPRPDFFFSISSAAWIYSCFWVFFLFFKKKQMRALRAVSLVNKQTRRQLVWDVIHIEVRLLDHPLRFNILLQMVKRKKKEEEEND
jgi:hypothetical protein